MASNASLTPDQINNVQYIVIKAHHKADEKDMLVGMFIGLRPLVEENTALVSLRDKYIFVEKGPMVHILSADLYVVDSIEVGHKAGPSRMTILAYTPEEQKDASEVLDKMYDAFKLANKTHENGLINTSFFIDMPEALKKDVGTSGPAISSGAATFHNRSGGESICESSGDHNAPGYIKKSTCGYDTTGSTYRVYKPKTISTSWITRTTKYPIESAIERMQIKIQALKNGTYKPPKLTIGAVGKNDDSKSAENNTESDTHGQHGGSDDKASTKYQSPVTVFHSDADDNLSGKDDEIEIPMVPNYMM